MQVPLKNIELKSNINIAYTMENCLNRPTFHLQYATALELQTKVPEDYAKFYWHREGPCCLLLPPRHNEFAAPINRQKIGFQPPSRDSSRDLLCDNKTSLREGSFEALMPAAAV